MYFIKICTPVKKYSHTSKTWRYKYLTEMLITDPKEIKLYIGQIGLTTLTSCFTTSSYETI